jgi:hypothetical protein
MTRVSTRTSPPSGHRVAGIDHEVHDDLIELLPVDADRQEPGSWSSVSLIFSPTSRFSRCIRSAIVSRRSTISSFSFCCRENASKLADKRRGAVRVLADLDKVAVIRVALVVAQQQQVAMAGDRGQEVVEVMRHAAGKLTHRLHLLALHELLFKALEFGRVMQNRQQRRARGIGDPAERDLQETLVVRRRARTTSERVGIRSATVSATQSRTGRPSPSTSEDRCPVLVRADPQKRLRLPVGVQDLPSGRYAATPPAAISNARAATEAAGGSASPGTA